MGTDDDGERNFSDDYDARIAAMLEKDPNPFARGHIICMRRGSWQLRAAPIVGYVRNIRITGSEEWAMGATFVAVPPGHDPEEVARSLAEPLVAFFKRRGASDIDDDTLSKVARGIRRVPIPVWDQGALRAAFEGLPERAIVILPEATRYHAKGAPSPLAVGGPRLMSDEELWTGRIDALQTALDPIIEQKELFVIVDTDQSEPCDAKCELFLDRAGWSLSGMKSTSAESVIAERMPAWRDLIHDGRLGIVLQEIEALSDLGERSRQLLSIQIMAAGGAQDQALADIRELEAIDDLPPDMICKLALIAGEAGGKDTAILLLRRARGQAIKREILEIALRAARRVGDDDLFEAFFGDLEQAHPESSVLHAMRLFRASEARDHATIADILAGDPSRAPDAALHRHLAAALPAAGIPDYLDVVATAPAGSHELARSHCSDHALAFGLAPHALALLLQPEAIAARSCTDPLLRTMEMIFLRRPPGGQLTVEQDQLELAVGTLIDRLASDTQDKSLRIRLIDLLDPRVAGDLGLPLALHALMKSLEQPDTIVDRVGSEPAISMASLLSDAAFHDRLERWLLSEQPIRIGHALFPREDLPGDPDAICEGLLYDIGREAPMIGNDDATGLLRMVGFGAAVAHHATDRDVDMALVRTAAIGLQIGGGDQPARDLAETLPDIATTPARRRLAWMGLSDVYARCQRKLDAVIYAAAGLRAHRQTDERQLWQELLLVHRILRSCGLAGLARQLLERSRDLLESMGRLDDYGHRIETMAITIDVEEARRHSISGEGYADLFARTVANAEAVFDANDEPGPAALLLGQMIREIEGMDITVPDDVHRLFADLTGRLPSGLARTSAVMAKDVPTSSDLLDLIKAASSQRYSEDVGTDVRYAVVAARRALDHDTTLADAATTCLAIDIVADRAIAQPGWTDAKRPPEVVDSASDLLERACEIAQQGTNILMMGLAHDGALVRLSIEADAPAVIAREAASRFSQERLNIWRKDYPFLYGLDNRPANAFLTTTEQLHLAAVPTGPTLVIADTEAQSFPPNLLRAPLPGFSHLSDFAGLQQPMSAAPSLSWLIAARQRTSLGDGRRLAWIPGGGTMEAIAQYSRDCLDRHQFHLDSAERLPNHLTGASMVIIAAHGSLNPEGGRFQVVSDEGLLKITAEDLARAVHNVGVVLLFVCSGGRSDKHPASDATLGLARDVLDQGAQAVVASPWPLESLVPPRWLPKFLDRWDAGDTLATAVHRGQRRAVREGAPGCCAGTGNDGLRQPGRAT